MRYGYSLLLREFVEAEEVEVGDCEQFQITCPACRDAVFKKVRNRPDGGVTHFLSHYRAETEDDKDCDLRVDSLAPADLAPYSAKGRGQTLDGFMTVLRDAILESQEMILPGTAQKVRYLMSRPAFSGFVDYPRKSIEIVSRLPNEMVTQMLANFPRFEGRSPFWSRRQSAYVLDVFEHLLKPQARSNLTVLGAAAFVNIAENADVYRTMARDGELKDRYPRTKLATDLIAALVAGKSKKALMKIATGPTGSSVAAAQERTQLIYQGIVAECIGPMVGILGGIPFPDIAKGLGFEAERARVATEGLPREFAEFIEFLERMRP